MITRLLHLLLWGVIGVLLLLVSPTAQAAGPDNFPNCRLGIGGAYSPYVGNYDIAQLNMGRYLDWSTRSNPATEIGLTANVEYIQTVRVHQLKTCGSHCIGSYVTPPQYSVTPSLTTLASIAASRPGMLWRIGNEIERQDWADGEGQDEITPELYATAYHAIHAAIKTADPTARVAVGSVILASPLRLAYLERVWNAYQTQFGYSMGRDVDAWVMHTFLIREVEGSWGANVPAGFSNYDSDPTNNFNPNLGFLYGVPEDSAVIFDKHHDLNEFKANVVAFRTWMAQHGEQNKPLLNTEYGILYKGFYGHSITSQQVKDYLTGSFDYLFSATDLSLGYPRDEYRLVQGWVWYSLEDSYWNGQIFSDSQTLSQFGLTWRDYVRNPAKPLAAQPQPNLRITRLQATANPPQVPLNGISTVTLTAEIANSGNVAAGPVTVSFWDGDPGNPQSHQIGADQIIATLGGCGAYRNVSLTWQRPAGEHPWFVRITPVGGETNLGDNIAGSSVTITSTGAPASADLAVDKTVSSAAAFTGDTITYTVTAVNNGPSLATAVGVTDSLPAGVSLLNYATSQGAYSPTTGVWAVDTLSPQTPVWLTVTGRVNLGAGGAPITNTAVITGAEPDPAPGNNSAAAVINPVAGVDLMLSKTVTNLTPFTSQRITFTIAITNTGPEPATNVTVTDDFPAQLTVAGVTASRGSFSPTSGVWQVGQMAAGDIARLTIAADIPAGLVGVALTNSAHVTASQVERQPLNNSASVTVIPVGSADVRLQKSVNLTAPYSTNVITFTLVAANAGPEPAVDVRVQDVLPAGLTFVNFSAPRGIYSSASGVWQIGVIAPSDAVTATLAARVAAGLAGQTITNRASITATGTDLIAGNNQAAASLWPVAQADLSLAAAASVNTGQIVYRLTAANLGPDNATGVTVTNILLPTGLALANFSTDRGAFSAGNGMWSVGALAAGATATLTLTTIVPSGQAGQNFAISNIQIQGTETDLEPANNSRAVAADSFHVLYLPLLFKK
ncbi:MAG: hypothetical protein FOGNACKC_03182 [Anaerolineae bacterium]|nr:hypothetical protein [Anaerolineae bacterium]